MAKQKPMPPTGRLLFEPVKAACRFSPDVVVSFSGGKDSVVVLDMCVRHFKRVQAFFMYQVPGLSFQEATLRWYENKYGIEILRVPHPELSEFLRYGLFRHHDLSVPVVGFNELYHYVRLQTGTKFIAAVERIADSIVRRAMMKKSGSIDVKRGRFYPVAYFRKEDVLRYIDKHQLKVSPESRFLGHSFRSFDPEDMYKVRKHYPDDYAKIERFFPFVGAGVEKFIRECAETGRALP